MRAGLRPASVAWLSETGRSRQQAREVQAQEVVPELYRDALMKRRSVLQVPSGISMGSALPITCENAARPERFLITVVADGGWDPTRLTDPKGNTLRADGRGPVNHYAAAAIKAAGMLQYAGYPDSVEPPPVTSPGHLDTFFTKHHQRLLVINGIDTGARGHASGHRCVWSSRCEAGYPTINALVAAQVPGQALVFPANAVCNDRAARVAAIQPRYARGNELQLDAFSARLPLEVSSGFKGQGEVALAAFASGLATSARLELGGFDTHINHDVAQTTALTGLLEGIDHLWAQIEHHGMQHSVTVLIGSDFGRSPWYNAAGGKDHWHVASMLAMGAGVAGNRTVGASTADVDALRLNPATLAPHSSGIVLTPAHIHRAVRDLFQVSATLDQKYPLNAEPLGLFG